MPKLNWGYKVYDGTMKDLFKKHFLFIGGPNNESWVVSPFDKRKVQKRVIPTLRMVISWVYPKVTELSDRAVVENFLDYIKKAHPDLYVKRKQKKYTNIRVLN